MVARIGTQTPSMRWMDAGSASSFFTSTPASSQYRVRR
jgi:hypothetical protein